jgi:hypothetical protein
MGPPSVDFTPIVPKKSEVYTYYDLKDPKIKKELAVLELAHPESDPNLSHFVFKDISKVLPFSDPGCPPDGICNDNLQTLIKMHIE